MRKQLYIQSRQKKIVKNHTELKMLSNMFKLLESWMTRTKFIADG